MQPQFTPVAGGQRRHRPFIAAGSADKGKGLARLELEQATLAIVAYVHGLTYRCQAHWLLQDRRSELGQLVPVCVQDDDFGGNGVLLLAGVEHVHLLFPVPGDGHRHRLDQSCLVVCCLPKAGQDAATQVKLLHAPVAMVDHVHVSFQVAGQGAGVLETAQLCAWPRPACRIWLPPDVQQLKGARIKELQAVIAAVADKERPPEGMVEHSPWVAQLCRLPARPAQAGQRPLKATTGAVDPEQAVRLRLAVVDNAAGTGRQTAGAGRDR
jgi:hypothetical protein